MRRFLMIAAAASIALVGLSANQCGGAKEDKATTEAPADAMQAKPDESMSDDSMSGNDSTVDEIPAIE
ncbi:MAG: hypothetical protein WBB50_09055 [Methyloceanibacter sp.]